MGEFGGIKGDKMKLSEISKEVKGWLIILIIIYVLAVLTVLVFDPRRISVEKELEGYKKSLNLEAREFAKGGKTPNGRV